MQSALKQVLRAKQKYCISGAAQRDGLTLIAVVLAADTTADRFETAKSLLNYGFANYGIDNPVKPGEKIGKPAVIKRCFAVGRCYNTKRIFKDCS